MSTFLSNAATSRDQILKTTNQMGKKQMKSVTKIFNKFIPLLFTSVDQGVFTKTIHKNKSIFIDLQSLQNATNSINSNIFPINLNVTELRKVSGQFKCYGLVEGKMSLFSVSNMTMLPIQGPDIRKIFKNTSYDKTSYFNTIENCHNIKLYAGWKVTPRVETYAGWKPTPRVGTLRRAESDTLQQLVQKIISPCSLLPSTLQQAANNSPAKLHPFEVNNVRPKPRGILPIVHSFTQHSTFAALLSIHVMNEP